MDPFRLVLRPSPARQAFGLSVQALLGAILLWLVVSVPPASMGWRLFLFALGTGALVLAVRGWRGAAQGIVLTEAGLHLEDGTPLAPLDRIRAVDRSAFTFKPANGFLLTLDAPLGRAWVPGLYWRVGRRLGVGGMTNAAETKAVAQALSILVAQRDAGAPG